MNIDELIERTENKRDKANDVINGLMALRAHGGRYRDSELNSEIGRLLSLAGSDVSDVTPSEIKNSVKVQAS